jgi:hypothetical protein
LGAQKSGETGNRNVCRGIGRVERPAQPRLTEPVSPTRPPEGGRRVGRGYAAPFLLSGVNYSLTPPLNSYLSLDPVCLVLFQVWKPA